MTDDDKQRIECAIKNCGNGKTVSESFAPFTDLLRNFAKAKNIHAFALACRTMFSGSTPNQWQIKEDAPNILRHNYMPAVLDSQYLLAEAASFFSRAASWDEHLRLVLDNPDRLQQELDRVIEDMKASLQDQV